MDNNALHLMIEEYIYLVDEGKVQPKENYDVPETTASVEEAKKTYEVSTAISIYCKSQPNEAQLKFLEKVMEATKVASGSYMILDESKTAHFQNNHSEKVICFDLNPVELGIQNELFPKYEVKDFASKSLLFVDSLEKIAQNKDKKQALWLGLKRMFGI